MQKNPTPTAEHTGSFAAGEAAVPGHLKWLTFSLQLYS
jgi:hypothetical protein